MQRQKRKVNALTLAVLMVGGTLPLFGAEEESYQTVLQPFLTEYCFGCHGPEKQKADVNFSIYGVNTKLIEDRKTWEKVHEMLMTREMPPKKERQPEEAIRDRVATFIQAELDKFDCSKGPAYPGRVTLRRLNRAEYNNSLRDLLGVDLKPADEFPVDGVGYGFDNIGDVLSLPPMLMEKYLAAAEKVVTNAVLAQYPPPPPSSRFLGQVFRAMEGTESGAVQYPGKTLGLYKNATTFHKFTVKSAGEYRIRAHAYQEQAGLEAARLAVLVDGEVRQEFDVPVEANKAEDYEFTQKLEAGERSLGLSYLNNYVVQDHPNPKLRGDRNLFVAWVEVVGPLNSVPKPPPESHRLIIHCDPLHTHTRDCARTVFTEFAQRAYRRPVSSNEVERLCRFVDVAQEAGGTFLEGIQLGLEAILTSPRFLFRWELDPEINQPTQVRDLDDWELASRLSYFLWSSIPDAELTELTRRGQLHQKKTLDAQVRRMLQDPKAEALVQNFAGQWVTLRNLDLVSPDPALYPDFDEDLRRAMKKETELFFGAIMREDRSLLDLIDADFTFVNERLAKHYGLPGVKGDQFQRVKLDKSSGRGGILTQGSILTLTSNPTRTSPVVRGKWVLEQILGTPPPPPPPNVPALTETQEAREASSLRERLEIHRAKPECATCHSKMDPIGFAFENFNAVGAWRNFDGKFPIDPSGTLPDGHPIHGPQDLKDYLKNQDTFARNLAEKMLTYALGRGLQYYDKCAVDDIYAALAQEDFRFSVLVSQVVQSVPFRKKAIGD